MAERDEPLSERELDVLLRLAAGESNKAIADGLSISPYTVKTHLRNIFIKLDVSTRTEAMTVALQRGVLSVGGPEANGEEPPANAEVMIAEALGTDGAEAVAGGPVAATAVAATAVAEGTPPAGVSHRWRNLAVALLALVGVLVGLFLFIQWREGSLFTTAAVPFTEQELGESR